MPLAEVRERPPRTVGPDRSDAALCTLAAWGAIGQAAVHVPVIEHHFVEAAYVGVGLVAFVVAGIHLAVRLLTGPDNLVWAATGLLGAAGIVCYLLSRTVGLPHLHHDIGNWADPLGTVAITCEAVMVSAATAHARRRRR
ncbi:MAG TPA: hypothetical protein VGE14_14365 [Marmoricola sp.]